MKRGHFSIGIILLVSLLSTIFIVFIDKPKGSNQDNEETEELYQGPVPKLKPKYIYNHIEKQIMQMTLEEKVGQLVVVGFDGIEMNTNIEEMIDIYKVGGFILFSDNIVDENQTLQLIKDINKTNEGEIPLFMSIDEEGGRVSRIPSSLIKMPSAKEVGELFYTDLEENNNINENRYPFMIGQALGKQVKALGFNIDYAPVLDIYSNFNNTVIGDRSFGTNSSIVGEVGIQVMKGIQEEGVVSVIKHFPGHGDTSEDSHVVLPLVNKDLSSLRELELIPFQEAIDNGADAVMVAHILMEKLDKNNPASFSKEIIQKLLRDEMKFDGVVITDDMTMGAIVENYDIGDAAIKSIDAGSDIILVCHGKEEQVKVINSIINSVKSGEITEERIDESVYRILRLKEKYNLGSIYIETINVKELNAEIEGIFHR